MEANSKHNKHAHQVLVQEDLYQNSILNTRHWHITTVGPKPPAKMWSISHYNFLFYKIILLVSPN